MERAPVQRRIGALADRREVLKRDLTASKRRAPQVLRGIGFAKRAVDKLKLMRGQTAAQAAKKLVQAGFRSKDAVAVYLFAKLCLPLVCGTGAVFALYILDMFSLQDQMKLVRLAARSWSGFICRNFSSRTLRKSVGRP